MPFIKGKARIVSIIASVLSLLICAAVIIHFFRGNQRVPDSEVVRDFFLDENTLQPERHTAYEIPPLPGKDGQPTIVIGCYYQVENQKKLCYLKKYPPEIKARLEEDMQKNNGNPTAMVWIEVSGEVLVRRPEAGSPWVKISSPEGREVINPPRNSQGFVAFPCLPN